MTKLPYLATQASIRTITGAASITVADWGKTLAVNLSTRATLSVAAVSTLPNGFWCELVNIGTAIGDVDGNSSETIDGYLVRTLGLGDCWKLFSDGSTLRTTARKGRLVEIQRNSPSATAQSDFDFASGFPADFDEFEVHIPVIKPAVDDTTLHLRVKTTGSLTVQTSAYVYGGRTQIAGGGADIGSTIDGISGSITLTRYGSAQGVGNAIGEHARGILRFTPNATDYNALKFDGSYMREDGSPANTSVTGWYGAALAITGLRFLFRDSVGTTQNISSGTLVLYGIRK